MRDVINNYRFKDMYTKQVLEHFRNPRNLGKLKNHNTVGQEGNPSCGDVMKIYLKIDSRKNKEGKIEEYIKDIKFETLGCAAAIAVSSLLTEAAKGKSVLEAKKITKEDILKDAGGLPPAKIHCSMLGIDALRTAIKNYEDKK